MTHSYQTYNPADETYGVRFSRGLDACVHAQRISATFARECWVIDTETGEIIAMYNHGTETYMA